MDKNGQKETPFQFWSAFFKQERQNCEVLLTSLERFA